MEVVPLASAALTFNAIKQWRLCGLSFKIMNGKKVFRSKGRNEDYQLKLLEHGLSRERLPRFQGENINGNKSEVFMPRNSTSSDLLLYYAHNDMSSKEMEILDELLNSSRSPNIDLVSELLFVYGRMQNFDMVRRILLLMKDSELLPSIFRLAITHFGKKGHLDSMEFMIKQMVSMGYPVDSTIGNAYILYYCAFGSLSDIETAYGRLKRSRILIEEDAIRAVALSYIKSDKFYEMGRFVDDVGLGRRNVGNLLWNLLLLSYAAQFKMKSLQREFVRMVESGFNPDINTFNIRLLAFSRMCLMWDLHLSLEHMAHDEVVPDLVTYGCVVDAYLDRRLGKNLKFAILDWNEFVAMSTDQFVFEAMGKGDFHLSSEVVLEHSKRKDWTYEMLVSIYLKKKFRSNQIFWNY